MDKKKIMQKRIQEIEEGITAALEQGSKHEDVLEIMMEILEATKVKNKLTDYLE